MEQEVLDAPKTVAIKVYAPIEAGIALMLDRHGYVLTAPPFVKDDAKALALAKLNRQELVKFRTTLEKARKAEKAESLAYGRLVDSEAARIQAFADPLELAYDRVITNEETRLESVRQAELEAERQRIAGHRARIQSIKEVRETAAMCRTADRLKQLIDGMPDHLEQPFEEFQGEAETVFNEICTVLQQLHGAKVEAEAAAVELARQQAEADRLAAQQREIDEQQARATADVAARLSAPLTVQDIADSMVDAEVKPCELRAPSYVPHFIAPLQTDHAGPPTLCLGQISTHLGFVITADFLRSLGFEPAGRERAAVLYHASSWHLIQAALVKHINALPELQTA